MEAPRWMAKQLEEQLSILIATSTAPFVIPFSNYVSCIRNEREIEVRLGQLDKEAAELRDENHNLQLRASKYEEEVLALSLRSKADEDARSTVAALQRELADAYRDKQRLTSEAVQTGAAVAAVRSQLDASLASLQQSRAEASSLREQVNHAADLLERERGARVAATSEVQAALMTREAALSEADRLRWEVETLRRRLDDQHDRGPSTSHGNEPLGPSGSTEAEEREMPGGGFHDFMNRFVNPNPESKSTVERPMTTLPAPPQSVTTPPPGAGSTLSDSGMESYRASDSVRGFQAPRVIQAHRGGCASVAAQTNGRLFATCGASDRQVTLWDVMSLTAVAGSASSSDFSSSTGPSSMVLCGMTSAVNDVSFTCTGSQVIAAGSDHSLHLWEVATGQSRHTLTGHQGPVTCVATNPLDVRYALSCSEDRSLKLWDLERGFAVGGVPCRKLPLALAATDGTTFVTGHLDGCIQLWDVRQAKVDAVKNGLSENPGSQAVVALVAGFCSGASNAAPPCPLSPLAVDTAVLAAYKDGHIALWDLRMVGRGAAGELDTASFAIGTIGCAGRTRSKLTLSPSRRYLAAPYVTGGVWVWDLCSPLLHIHAAPQRVAETHVLAKKTLSGGASTEASSIHHMSKTLPENPLRLSTSVEGRGLTAAAAPVAPTSRGYGFSFGLGLKSAGASGGGGGVGASATSGCVAAAWGDGGALMAVDKNGSLAVWMQT